MNLHLNFGKSDPKSHFWANFGRKSQSCSFRLKTGTHDNLRMLILYPALVFWISNFSVFGLTWAKKVKVVSFVWKLAYMVSRGFWFLFQHNFSELPVLNLFLGKFGRKKSKFSVLSENWHAWYLEHTDSYSEINFLNFKTYHILKILRVPASIQNWEFNFFDSNLLKKWIQVWNCTELISE